MANLPGQHGDLAAMVGIVRNQIAQKPRDVGTKTFHTPIARQGAADDHAQSVTAAFQNTYGLRRSYCTAVELRRNLLCLNRLQPHDTNVVHMGHDWP